MLIRCSSLYKLMTKARSGDGLSETAKTHIKELVVADVYGVSRNISNKYTKKGVLLEDEAIKAIGLVTATRPRKNTDRLNNGFITGECDLIDDQCIRDTKCSWSAETFPFFQEDADKAVKESGYDWQGRGYMWLYDRPVHHIHYVLLPTPFELLGEFDDVEMHVNLPQTIPLKRRIKTVSVERDRELEQLIEHKVGLARIYAANLYAELGMQAAILGE